MPKVKQKDNRKRAKRQAKLAQQRNAEAERPVTKAVEYLRDKGWFTADEAKRGPDGKIHPVHYFQNPLYKKYDPDEVYISAIKEPIYADKEKTVVKEDGFAPVLNLRDPVTKEWKVIWKFHVAFPYESEALMTMGRLLPLVATQHSMEIKKFKWDHYNERKGQAAARQAERMRKQAKHMAASRGHNK